MAQSPASSVAELMVRFAPATQIAVVGGNALGLLLAGLPRKEFLAALGPPSGFPEGTPKEAFEHPFGTADFAASVVLAFVEDTRWLLLVLLLVLAAGACVVWRQVTRHQPLGFRAARRVAAFVCVGLGAICVTVATLQPNYLATRRLEAVGAGLASPSSFESIGRWPAWLADRETRQYTVLYSWLHGVDADALAPAPCLTGVMPSATCLDHANRYYGWLAVSTVGLTLVLAGLAFVSSGIAAPLTGEGVAFLTTGTGLSVPAGGRRLLHTLTVVLAIAIFATALQWAWLVIAYGRLHLLTSTLRQVAVAHRDATREQIDDAWPFLPYVHEKYGYSNGRLWVVNLWPVGYESDAGRDTLGCVDGDNVRTTPFTAQHLQMGLEPRLTGIEVDLLAFCSAKEGDVIVTVIDARGQPAETSVDFSPTGSPSTDARVPAG